MSAKADKIAGLRLYQDIRFNRPIEKSKDYICPGGYEVTFLTNNGERRSFEFDFMQYGANIDDDDPCILHCLQEYPDLDAFPDFRHVTEDMLANVIEVNEWFIYVDLDTDSGDVIIPKAILDCCFTLGSKDFPMRTGLVKSIVPTYNEEDFR